MRKAFWLAILAACAPVPAEPCPEGVVLADADLPCDCQGARIDSLSCGSFTCEASGLSVFYDTGATTTTTTDCTSPSTGNDTGR